MGLSDLRKKKLEHIFRKFLDINGDGSIEKSDLDAKVEIWKKNHGWTEDSAACKYARDALTKLWAGITTADKDGDGKVSLEEWFGMWDGTNIGTKTTEWQKQGTEFMFKLHDASGDGEVSSEEYAKVYAPYGFGSDQCKTSFNKITDNGSSKLDKTLFRKLSRDYFFSDDAAATGNSLFLYS